MAAVPAPGGTLDRLLGVRRGPRCPCRRRRRAAVGGGTPGRSARGLARGASASDDLQHPAPVCKTEPGACASAPGRRTSWIGAVDVSLRSDGLPANAWPAGCKGSDRSGDRQRGPPNAGSLHAFLHCVLVDANPSNPPRAAPTAECSPSRSRALLTVLAGLPPATAAASNAAGSQQRRTGLQRQQLLAAARSAAAAPAVGASDSSSAAAAGCRPRTAWWTVQALP